MPSMDLLDCVVDDVHDVLPDVVASGNLCGNADVKADQEVKPRWPRYFEEEPPERTAPNGRR